MRRQMEATRAQHDKLQDDCRRMRAEVKQCVRRVGQPARSARLTSRLSAHSLETELASRRLEAEALGVDPHTFTPGEQEALASVSRKRIYQPDSVSRAARTPGSCAHCPPSQHLRELEEEYRSLCAELEEEERRGRVYEHILHRTIVRGGQAGGRVGRRVTPAARCRALR